ncbi:aminotransferase class I/II-fold pyridoxal phosphate-dependent enzyme [Sulfurovum sp.]|jgi:O-acetylhomoserine (thiol)-lyase|uniref:aminotransferase class I/II-fold pyridoxal phosphate-dependent enzyme n=1 Tax=Sulfurovum sp. TaxID=1969726 RepID=UPI002A3628D7|nr:aminotransferase class I/II-fold pyridoxal phosphate-dependent enzyme [Sulfurovum sp.]MDY0401813.1 aminotransferase class I/II-fold pyridoxal phosphate-dependent enzyme [Sulfurovum sp.]
MDKTTVDFEQYSTLMVHSVGNRVGPIAPVMVPSAAFGYESAEEAEGIFAGSVAKPLYARVGNPTNGKLESIVAKMEGGIGAIATASGMGAMSMVSMAILNSGDELLCIGGFFGGTYSLVNETLARFGITNSFCEVDDFDHIESRLKSGIKMVMMESVGNPSLRLPDLQRIIDLCNQYETILVIDNTATPILLRPIEMGADIVVHSSTKNISGHSAALGGIAVFRSVDPENDKLLHPKYADLHKFVKKMGNKAFMAIFKKRAIRDMGMTANAFGSFMTMIGLETLPLRIERINQNVERVAAILQEKLPDGVSVNHPSLPGSPDYERYRSDFPQGCGPLLTLDCGTKERAFRLLDALKVVIQTANIGDNRSLALHMTSTIFSDFDEAARKFLGVHEGLIRVSIGLEDPQVVAEDFIQAANAI